jgi:hypothetical protein
MTKWNNVKIHDCFNIIYLSIICLVNSFYLFNATEFSKFGTNELGSDSKELFSMLISLFVVYVISDTIWVLFIPSSVLSNPKSIVIHHCVTLFLTSAPLIYPQFAWHASICIIVELNTLLLTSRRNVDKDGLLFKVLNFLFYFSWMVLRLILFPILLVFYSSEYFRHSRLVGTYWNIIIFSPILHSIITLLSFKWTIDMLWKKQKHRID